MKDLKFITGLLFLLFPTAGNMCRKKAFQQHLKKTGDRKISNHPVTNIQRKN